jgi:hypothetical protein
VARKEPRKISPPATNEPSKSETSSLSLRRGFLVADKLWQPDTDVAAVNRLMRDPAFRGLYETAHFVPPSLKRKKMLPLLPKDRDDPRIDLFADWFLSTFREFSGCADFSGHPGVQEFSRSHSGNPSNAYLRGQSFALSTPDAEYWEGYGLRKGQIAAHAWNTLGGKVLDLTWHHGRAHADSIYLGIPIGADFLQWCQASGSPVAFLYWAKRRLDGKE